VMAKIGRRWAGFFDGEDDYVVITDYKPVVSSGFTAIVVFRQPKFDYTVDAYLFNQAGIVESGGASWGILVMNTDSRVRAFVADDTQTYDLYSENSIGDGKWHIVVLKYDGTTIYGYLDGQNIGSMSANVQDSTQYDVTIGAQAVNLNNKFYGDIAMAVLVTRPLTDDEIAKLNEDPFDPNNVPKDGLVGWWDFNKADWQNGILPDLSGNGNDGDIVGVTPIEVLVKRGTGNLPEYDLPWSWVCDGIDDYCIVDFKNWAVKKAMSFAVWNNTYAGNYKEYNVKDYAKGIGYYDADKDAWRVDAGEEGYFFDEEIEYDETLFGRGIWFYVKEVQVDDNTTTDKLFRYEVIDANSGEVIFSKDYTADQFPSDGFSVIVTARYGFVPYGRYRVRLYSYGNVGFWIKYAKLEGFHGALLYSYGSNDFRVYKYYSKLHMLVWKTDGSYEEANYNGTNIRNWEHFVLGWSNLDQKFVFHVNGQNIKEESDTVGLDMRGQATQIIFGASSENIVNNRYTGEIASIMLFDRLLSDVEVSDLYNKKFVLDGLVHWWVVDENGNLVDLVTGNSYEIQGSPYIRRLYDDDGRLNSGKGAIVFDIIGEERGQ